MTNGLLRPPGWSVDVRPRADMDWMSSPSGKRILRSRKSTSHIIVGKSLPQVAPSEAPRRWTVEATYDWQLRCGLSIAKPSASQDKEGASRSAKDESVSEALSRSAVAMLVVEKWLT